jgi:hypothetical protein
MTNKLERDIEEVLAKIDRFPKRTRWARFKSGVRGFFRGLGEAFASIPFPRLSLGQVLLLGIAVVVIAYVFGDNIASPSIVRLFIIGGIVVFLVAFILSLRRHSSASAPEKRWRGQPMDLDARGEGQSWWKRWRSRR